MGIKFPLVLAVAFMGCISIPGAHAANITAGTATLATANEINVSVYPGKASFSGTLAMGVLTAPPRG